VFLTASSRRGRSGESDAAVQVASIKTLVGALDTIPAPHLIIPDECHHAPAANGERSSIASQTHTPSGSRRRPGRAEIERIER
jgi:superfamily II DNA or RNA helicase